MHFWRSSEVPCEKFLPVTFLLFGNSSRPMVLGPVSCPAEMHCTTDFVLRNGKTFKVGGR